MSTRTLTDTDTISWDEATTGQVKANIADGSVTNAKLAETAEATIKGRQAGGGTGDAEDLTEAQVKNIVGMPTTTVDNTLPRFDGTAGNLQTTGITVDDSDNITGINDLAVAGNLSGLVDLDMTGDLSGLVNQTQTGYHDMAEISEPASPAANVARLFAIDDGGGFSRVRAKDSSGNILYLDGRERLTAARTYYVRTDGSDSNDGLANTSGGAFLTIQHAYDVIADTLDLGAYTVTIQVAAGTYSRPGSNNHILFISRPWVGGKGSGGIGGVGGGAVQIIGDRTTPANCILDVNSNLGILANRGIFVNCGLPGVLDVAGFQFTDSSGGGIGLFNNGAGSMVNIADLDFGEMGSGGVHMWAAQAGVIFCYDNDYTISGDADKHIHCEVNGAVDLELGTITLTGTPAFAICFARAESGGVFYSAVTYSGSATGKRFITRSAGSIQVFDNAFGELGFSALSTLPGNASGQHDGGAVNEYGGFNGLNIGWDGAPQSNKINIGDSTFQIDYNSGNPLFVLDTGDYIVYDRASNTLVFHPGGVDRFLIDGNGMPIFQPGSATPATLSVNGQITMTLTSNTNLRFSARGSDGVTRVANLTLA
jgi:hypothetical protein